MIKQLLEREITQQELLNYYNATIVYDKLPSSINGVVFCYENINTIIINENLSSSKKKKTILHELAHLELQQLCQIDKDLLYLKINQYENEADGYIQFILDCIKEEQKYKIG